MPIHQTKATLSKNVANSMNDYYMKKKIQEELQIRFDSKNIQITITLEALDSRASLFVAVPTLNWKVEGQTRFPTRATD